MWSGLSTQCWAAVDQLLGSVMRPVRPKYGVVRVKRVGVLTDCLTEGTVRPAAGGTGLRSHPRRSNLAGWQWPVVVPERSSRDDYRPAVLQSLAQLVAARTQQTQDGKTPSARGM